jgi:hypothetical protein
MTPEDLVERTNGIGKGWLPPSIGEIDASGTHIAI